MSDSGDAASVPGFSSPSSGAGLGRALAARVRTLTSPPPPGRLTSLRTRDLTLGGGFKKTKVTEHSPGVNNAACLFCVKWK